MKKYKNMKIPYNNKILISIFVATFVTVSSGVINAGYFTQKGELNDDGKIDYIDVELLESHLIHSRELPANKRENADMNNDGKITVTDLTLLIKKIENTLDYKVSISDVEQEEYYPEQNDEITLKFNATVSYDAFIKKAVINGQEIEVKKVEQTDNEYSFTTNTGNTSGIKEYHITEVELDNGKKVGVDYTLKIDVLKELPTIENYTIEENINEQKIKMSFNLKDKDDAISEAKLKIIDQEEQIIKEQDISKGQNEVEIEVEEEKLYKVKFLLSYDLDTNQLDKEEDHTGTSITEKDYQMIIDYNLSVNNIATKKDDNLTNTFEKNQAIGLVFESTNATTHEVAKVKVNGKEYEVVKKDNQYNATIDGITQIGETQIVIEEIILTNGKKFTLENNNSVTVQIIKRKPTIEEFTTEENIEQNNIKVAFNLKDEDQAIETAKIVLLDSEGNEIANQELSEAEIRQAGKIEKTLTTKLTSKYKIKITATYNNETESTILFEQDIQAKTRAIIKEAIANKDYVQKNGNVTITYNIETNKTEEITKIRVSNTDCQVTKLDNGKYEVVLTLGEQSGIKDLTTTKIFYSDDTFADVNNTIKIEVLKDKPSIQNFKQQDNEETSEVTLDFDLIDQDESLINAKAVLTKKDDTTINEEKAIVVGKNNITFSVENAKLYTLEIKTTYDLDTNMLENKPQEDNKVTDETILSKEIQLLSDYELQISNIKTFKEETESKYFEKDEDIIVKFESTNITNFVPVKAVINGKEYNVTKTDNTYQATINGFEESGIKDITIEKVILDNTKEIQITQNNLTKIEILKDIPTVIDFAYVEADDNTITSTFKVVDTENTITSGNVVIVDNAQKTIKTQEMTKGENTITFTKNGSESYKVKVLANYDLDTNNLETGKNEYTNQEIHQEDIYVTLERKIEMKDITRFSVYQLSGNETNEKMRINVADLDNLDNFIVKVEMKDMPIFYSTIKEYKIEEEKLKFVLNDENMIQYVGHAKQDKLELTYGEIENGVSEKNDLLGLIGRIKENPNGTFNLQGDYDAKGVNSDESLINLDVPFTGTINGNGYKIYNLDKPLFKEIEGATIQNLILEDVTLDKTASRGSIANIGTNVNIKNVHVKNLQITTKSEKVGGIVGQLTEGIIEECSATNISVITSHTRTGGIVGNATGGTIKNCYTKGEITLKQTKDANGIGGILGFADATPQANIENCITKINFVANIGGRQQGGIIGAGVSSTIVLKNNVSLSTGAGAYKIYGYAVNRASTNNYELEESTLVANSPNNAVRTIAQSNVTKEFFKDSASFDENIWDLTNASYDNLPILKNNDPSKEPAKEVTEDTQVYIPNRDRLQKLSNYDVNKQIAYSNVYKLMPFYDSKYIVLDGNKIETDNVLNTKIIKYILPYNNDKKLLTQITDENYRNIASIKVIFTDDSTQDYNITFDEYKENIATFNINELGLKYNFGEFVLKSNLSMANTLKAYIENLDYTEDLDILTLEEDSRIYRDYYNENTKTNILEFVLKLLQYSENGTITIENNVLNKKLEKELLQDDKIKEILYSYNYYKRWYDIEIGGAKVYDLMLCNSKLFADNMSIEKLSEELMSTTSAIRAVSQAHTFYLSNISKYTGKQNVGEFLDYIITTVGGYEDVNDWFTENYQGIVKEVPARNHPEVEYRAYGQLKKRINFLIPFLTLPDNSAYMISSPTQFLVGAQRGYIQDPTNPEQKQRLIGYIENYSVLIGNFYTTTAGFIPADRLNRAADIQVDRRTVVHLDGTSEYCTAGETQEPFHKNFNEVVGYWAAANGNAAYATGSNVYWVATAALTSFGTWTHESGHNQDSKIFLKGNGRRGGAEDYADGNTSQGGGDGAQNFNLSYDRDLDFLTSTNLSPERIDSTEKIESYYKAMYETWDLLDYILAKAFLTLTPEEQSKIATQVDYPNAEAEDATQATMYSSTRWSVKTKEDFEKMNLETIEDLWDNQVAIYPGITSSAIRPGVGKYGYGSIYPTRWYQPHNPYGRPDSYTLKSLAWEMLGIGGYDGGYITYYSRISANDVDAIQKVTKDPTMTWKRYKMERYDYIKTKIEDLKYVDVDEIYNQYVQALKIDAKNADRNATASMNVKRQIYHYLKRVTNDFRSDPLSPETIEITHIKTAEEFKKIQEKRYGYYVLDNDIDVSSLTGTNAIIDGYFVGKLDGQGHKIIGNTLPLFEKLDYSKIYNLTIEGSRINVTGQQVGAIAKTTLLTDLTNVKINDAQIISNLDQIGSMFGYAQQVILNNCHVTNTQVQGRTNIGGLIGYARYATITESTANTTTMGTANSVAGFVGLLQESNVFNSYAVGEITGNQNIGGFVGVANSATIENSFSAVKVNARSNSGGFVAQSINNTKISNSIALGNCINAYKFDGRTVNDIIANYKNNYEFDETTGTSTLNRTGIDFNGKISVATLNNIVNPEFYTNTLKWSKQIWDFSNIQNEGLPKLKNDDTNNITNFMGRIEISSVEDFQKISEKLDGIYVLKQDLDFTGYTGSGVVIASNFTGKLEGNGHTISNLTNNALFENFRGTVQNLNISNFSNRSTGDNIAAFAKNSSNATFKNMKFEHITIEGRGSIGTVVGTDNRGSIFDKISVKDTNITVVNARGAMFAGGIVGAQYGGKITNVYVEGRINTPSFGAGGIVGATGNGTNVIISNAISKVDVTRTGNLDSREFNAGIVGNVADASKLEAINNSIALGNMTGYNNTMVPGKFIRIAEATKETIIAKLNKCYECTEKTGVSNVSETTSGHLDTISTQNLNEAFYRFLQFDETIWDFSKINEQKCPQLK